MTAKLLSFETKIQGNKAYTQWYYGGDEIYTAEKICGLFNELVGENVKLKEKTISLKQLDKILEEIKEEYILKSECFAEKLLIKTIFRRIDEYIESREVEE